MKMAGIFAVVLASLALASPAVAVPPGSDLFVTDPSSTEFAFAGDFAIPAGFFEPGSKPFSGTIDFAGTPLGPYGDADTVVRRTEPADLPAVPSTDTVPIEIIQLQLQSVEPIQVQGGSTTQLWDVRVDLSPTPQPTGQMVITKSNDLGGTFDSTLPVIPRFTFTRQGDGVQRIFDLGQQKLSTQVIQALSFRANSVPWYNGDCPGSIFRAPGVNDGFCPGVTEAGEKQLTVEQALSAQHGVYPAQPLQNHYKCYSVESQGRFNQRTVDLTDQFGFARVRVLRPARLCNPVQKNAERIENKLAHLKCYTISTVSGPSTGAAGEYLLRNQFGTQKVAIGKAEQLCLPSRKQIVGKTGQPSLGSGSASLLKLGDHYKCYKATGAAAAVVVSLKDQFHTERARVAKLLRLCTPVQKNETKIQHPLVHLACYQIFDVTGGRPFSPLLVRVRNQFGIEVLRVLRPKELCVPSQKIRKDGGGPPPEIPLDLDLSCQPTSVTAPQNGTAQVACRVAAVSGTSGRTTQVTVSCQGTQGVQCTPSPSSGVLTVDSFFDVVVEITASQSGTATVTASSPGTTDSADVAVTVEQHGGGG